VELLEQRRCSGWGVALASWGFFITTSDLFLSYFRFVVFLSLLLGCHHIANLFHQLPLLDNRTGVRDSWCGQ
jgi:hypothetical protein